ncbi:MAG: sigma-70 family RNA polymerase sigma factor, partial [Limisphaerales bacterium]
FLLTAVKFFLSHAREKARAAKRGGTHAFLALDEFTEEAREHLEFATSGSPEDEFDRQWALQVLDLAMRDLEAEYRDSGRSETFERLKPYLIADPPSGEYEQCSRQWDMSSGAIAVAVHRLRQRFAVKVRDQLRQTLGQSEDVHAELRYLMRLLAM